MYERDFQQIIEESCECPTCGACPGEPCEDGKGDIRFPHNARVKLATEDSNAK